jgi:two-component system nitrogen regulation response regulator GlnG
MTVFQSVDSDATLPAVAAGNAGSYGAEELLATIVFHPATARIGEHCALPLTDRPFTLGRLEPIFASGSGAGGLSLGDKYISRRALEFEWQDSSLVVRRLPDSSRCRLASQEVDEPIRLEPAQLRAGVPLLLAHSVVLLLRVAPAAGPEVDSGPGCELLGSSRYMRELRRQLGQVAASDLDLLVCGETGTGKELVARTVHRASRRSKGPLVAVNMAAIPSGLAAAALFGSRKGAYTGAERAAPGYFEQARGGTLFLDEVGDAPAEIQPQLLRALQQREIQQVGGPVRPVELRVISATDAAVDGAECGFNSALRHRLGACEIQLRPLRGHPEDIGELTWHFLQQAAREQGKEGMLPNVQSCPQAVAAWAELFYQFLVFRWPGNVRQLVNFANQVIVASEDRPVMPASVQRALRQTVAEPDSAGDKVAGMQAGATRSGVTRSGATRSGVTRSGVTRSGVTRSGATRSIHDIAEDEFDRVLEENLFEFAPAARQMRVSRQSIYRRIDDSPRHRRASQVPLPEVQAALAAAGGDVAAAALQLRVSASGLRARLRAAALEFS